jgi:hypothetical protein
MYETHPPVSWGYYWGYNLIISSHNLIISQRADLLSIANGFGRGTITRMCLVACKSFINNDIKTKFWLSNACVVNEKELASVDSWMSISMFF